MPFESDDEEEEPYLEDLQVADEGDEDDDDEVLGFEAVLGTDGSVIQDLSPLPLPVRRVRELEKERIAQKTKDTNNVLIHQASSPSSPSNFYTQVVRVSPHQVDDTPPSASFFASPLPSPMPAVPSPASFTSFTPFSAIASSRKMKENIRPRAKGLGMNDAAAKGSLESLLTLKGADNSDRTMNGSISGIRLQRFDFETWLDMEGEH